MTDKLGLESTMQALLLFLWLYLNYYKYTITIEYENILLQNVGGKVSKQFMRIRIQNLEMIKHLNVQS